MNNLFDKADENANVPETVNSVLVGITPTQSGVQVLTFLLEFPITVNRWNSD